mmetsp:Transcript_4516/g.9811  ORF Transcript_4516/g.9811 Transcript_4516/m.9811 type:complete len:277 (-) Transcript_4516:791-1621(-)
MCWSAAGEHPMKASCMQAWYTAPPLPAATMLLSKRTPLRTVLPIYGRLSAVPLPLLPEEETLVVTLPPSCTAAVASGSTVVLISTRELFASELSVEVRFSASLKGELRLNRGASVEVAASASTSCAGAAVELDEAVKVVLLLVLALLLLTSAPPPEGSSSESVSESRRSSSASELLSFTGAPVVLDPEKLLKLELGASVELADSFVMLVASSSLTPPNSSVALDASELSVEEPSEMFALASLEAFDSSPVMLALSSTTASEESCVSCVALLLSDSS